MSHRWRVAMLAAMVCPYIAAGTPCEKPGRYQDILKCAINNHPEVLKQTSVVTQASRLNDVAGQRPNPELAAKAAYGGGFGQTAFVAEGSITHTFELGGKRDGRLGKASAQERLSNLELEQVRNEVFIKTFLNLVRIRQIKSERALINEALATTNRIVTLYRSRPRLSPEQTVSFEIFRMAGAEYSSRQKKIENEEYELRRFLALATEETEIDEKLLPPYRASWGEEGLEDSGENDSLVKVAQGTLQVARSESEIAASNAWPDLKLGPSWETQDQGPGNSYQAFGLTVVIPIPIYHRNGGEKSYASAGAARAEANLEITKKELAAKRDIWRTQYRSAIRFLNELASTPQNEKNHRNVEKMFERGLIASPLVVESHRQNIEFEKGRNEQELLALEAWYRLRASQGKLLEETI